MYNPYLNEAHSVKAEKYIYQIITVIKYTTGKLHSILYV